MQIIQLRCGFPYELQRGGQTVDHLMEHHQYHSHHTCQLPPSCPPQNLQKFIGYSALGSVCKVTLISHCPLISNSHISRSTVVTSECYKLLSDPRCDLQLINHYPYSHVVGFQSSVVNLPMSGPTAASFMISNASILWRM